MKTFEEQINELAAPVQKVIKEEFDKKLEEARETIYAQARKEINEKYKADFEALVKGSEAFIKESIEEECDDLNKEKEELKEKSEKCDESLVKFQKMIAEQLAKEVVGIRKERAQLSEKLASFDKFIKESISEYANSLNEEKQKYIKSTAEVIENGLKMQESAKSAFIKTAVKTAADMIYENMAEEIASLKKDIKEAQQNEFGKRIFEQFSGEFKAIFLNENKEIQKIKAEKAELENKIKKADRLLESKNLQVSALKDEIEVQKELRKRDSIIAEASKGLSSTKQEVLKRMVESVPTERLEKTISEYIPSVLGQTTTKKFTESKVVKTAPKMVVKTGDSVNESVQEKKEPAVAPKNNINEAIANIELDEEYMDRMLGI